VRDSEKMPGNRSTRLPWIAAALLLCLLPGSGLGSTAKKKAQARAEFGKAERLRAKLGAKPETQRQPAKRGQKEKGE
jgi:hypothetical protein